MGETLMSQNRETSVISKNKIIKRYQNRKLYDTQQSCYVTLDDIAKMIRANEEVTVIDNKTKNDITAATLTQIIFEAEKKATQHAPLFTLREIIQNGNGSISSYLAKLGAFTQDQVTESIRTEVTPPVAEPKPSVDNIKQALEQRVASAANLAHGEGAASTSKNFAHNDEDQTPDLPTSSSQNFNN